MIECLHSIQNKRRNTQNLNNYNFLYIIICKFIRFGEILHEQNKLY